jgi:hypothetical protein
MLTLIKVRLSGSVSATVPMLGFYQEQRIRKAKTLVNYPRFDALQLFSS